MIVHGLEVDAEVDDPDVGVDAPVPIEDLDGTKDMMLSAHYYIS
ncbi:hypothetical protein [Leptothoe kymatousa]|nr:hypothetical protein [Leptothoe kymatousa]